MTNNPHFLLDLRLADLADLVARAAMLLRDHLLAAQDAAGPSGRGVSGCAIRCGCYGARGCRKRPTKLAMVGDSADRAPGPPGDPGGLGYRAPSAEKAGNPIAL